MNTKPMIVNMIFEPSHYDDMFILNKAAQGRLDQMSQQFEVVCNGLNENDGQAIKTMDDSASLIRSNMNKVKPIRKNSCLLIDNLNYQRRL